MTPEGLIEELASLGTAAPRMADLPRLLGIPSRSLSRVAAAGLEAGLLEVWEDSPGPPPGPALILSELAAERLGLALDADGMRWVRPNDPARDVEQGPGDWRCRQMIEGEPGKLGLAELLEDVREPPFAFEEVLPVPRRVERPPILLGLSMAWPVPPITTVRAWTRMDGVLRTSELRRALAMWRETRGKCGCCLGRALPPSTYCLVCDAPLPERADRERRIAAEQINLGGGTGPACPPVPGIAAMPGAKLKKRKRRKAAAK